MRPMRRGVYRRRRAGVLGTLGVAAVLVIWGVSAAFGGPSRVARLVRSATGGGQAETAIDPGFFAPGACEELAPTSGDAHETVFLDAGHGGVDPGGTGTTESGAQVVEATTTLPVELDAAKVLRAAGYTVVVSRTEDTTVARIPSSEIDDGSLDLEASHDDVAARDICANDAHAKLLVGIYFDAGSSEEAGSITGYDPDRSFAADNLRFANLLQSDVLAAMNAQGWAIPDDGVNPDTGLGSVASTDDPTGLSEEAASYNHLLELGPAQAGYFTTPSQMPGAIIEPLYLTDPFEGSLAASSQGQEVIGTGVAQAVEQYFASPTAGTSTTTAGGSSGSSDSGGSSG